MPVSSVPTKPGYRRRMIVARFEAFVAANPGTPLHLAEICGAIDVAERSLRTACVSHLGMSPKRYLALQRMHLVRRALLQAMPSTVTVTAIASDHGFWELGRFSTAYRALFGETPSATLNRMPECWQPAANRHSPDQGVTAMS